MTIVTEYFADCRRCGRRFSRIAIATETVEPTRVRCPHCRATNPGTRETPKTGEALIEREGGGRVDGPGWYEPRPTVCFAELEGGR